MRKLIEVSVHETLRLEARRRMQVVTDFIPLIDPSRGMRHEVAEAFCQEREITVSTLYRWLADYRRGGIAALLPKWGKTRGQFLALSASQQDIIKDLYLTDRLPSPTTVYRQFAVQSQRTV